MIIRREVFEAIGLMDEGYFMYFEEVDFCHRARRAGWPCWYVPAARVVHLVGQSSGVTDPRRAARKRRPGYWFRRASALLPLQSRARQDGAGGPGLVARAMSRTGSGGSSSASPTTNLEWMLLGLHPLQLLAGDDDDPFVGVASSLRPGRRPDLVRP